MRHVVPAEELDPELCLVLADLVRIATTGESIRAAAGETGVARVRVEPIMAELVAGGTRLVGTFKPDPGGDHLLGYRQSDVAQWGPL